MNFFLLFSTAESEQIKVALKRGLDDARPVLPPIKGLDNIHDTHQDHQ